MEVISLTGPDSHRLTRAPGVGSCTLGPYVRGATRPDLEVGPGDTLDWTVFDPFTTPAGSPWPRWFDYEGDDTGWIDWSARRPIESFRWTPHTGHDLDAGGAGINELAVAVRRAPLRLVLPAGRFSAAGDLSLLTPRLAPGAECPPLHLSPDTAGTPDTPYRLPELPALAGATSVAVSVTPLRQPFDCASLAQFPGLRRLELAGSLTGLDALAGMPGLTTLHLRFVPDLSALPPLATWPDLTHLVVWNSDAQTGKRLRAELRGLTREWRHCSVSQLRGPGWFANEYGLPFSAWPAKSARAGVKAYRAAEMAIGGATTAATIEDAVRGFVRAINRLPGIETTEREDAAAAVDLLTAATPLGDLRPDAAVWFDDTRDF